MSTAPPEWVRIDGQAHIRSGDHTLCTLPLEGAEAIEDGSLIEACMDCLSAFGGRG